MTKRRFKIEFVEERHGYAIVEVDGGREEAEAAFFRGDVLHQHVEQMADVEDVSVLFDPPQRCARDGCSRLVGPSDDTPTPDEFCSLHCAVQAGVVKLPEGFEP